MKVVINGTTYAVADGASISVKNGEVVIHERRGPHDRPEVAVTYSFTESVRVEVHGNCGSINTVSGDVVVSGDVSGSIQTVSGDVECQSVSGGVKTVSGDITTRK